jgi:hypothetical protein
LLLKLERESRRSVRSSARSIPTIYSIRSSAASASASDLFRRPEQAPRRSGSQEAKSVRFAGTARSLFRPTYSRLVNNQLETRVAGGRASASPQCMATTGGSQARPQPPSAEYLILSRGPGRSLQLRPRCCREASPSRWRCGRLGRDRRILQPSGR